MEEFTGWLVHPFESVGSEIVPLRLEKIRWEVRLAVAVKIAQSGAKCRHGNSEFDGRLNGDPPVGLSAIQDVREEGVEDEILELRVFPIRLGDAIEEACPDDATAAPDAGDIAKVEIPIVKLACFANWTIPCA